MIIVSGGPVAGVTGAIAQRSGMDGDIPVYSLAHLRGTATSQCRSGQRAIEEVQANRWNATITDGARRRR